MKAILCFPFEDEETGRAIYEAMENNGVKTLPVDANLSAELLPMIVKEGNGDFDFILCSRTPELYPPLVQVRRMYPKIKLAVWNVDVRETRETWGALNYMFEFVDFHFDVSQRFFKNSIFLPQGLDDRHYYPVTPPYHLMHDWNCDVGFIGNVHPRFHPNRAQALATMRNMFRFRHFQGVFKYKHSMAVACSKVNLCWSAFEEVENSYSVRNWKVLGANGVAIDVWHPGIEEYFKGYVESFKCVDELIDKCQFMLANYDIYHQKAIEAGAWVRESQTYTHRVKDMLGYIFD